MQHKCTTKADHMVSPLNTPVYAKKVVHHLQPMPLYPHTIHMPFIAKQTNSQKLLSHDIPCLRINIPAKKCSVTHHAECTVTISHVHSWKCREERLECNISDSEYRSHGFCNRRESQYVSFTTCKHQT